MSATWNKLAALMEQHGLSKSALGRIAGVSPSAVNGWRVGGRLSPAVKKRLEDHFKMRLSECNWAQSDAGFQETRELCAASPLPPLQNIEAQLKQLSERFSALEQLLIKILAEKEKH